MATGFLHLPYELRLEIYEHFLSDHQQVRRGSQPSNAHLRLLRTCSLVFAEANLILRRYASLRNEHQVHAFLIYAPPPYAAQIQWADVANSGHVFYGVPAGSSIASSSDQPNSPPPQPLSNLHLVLARMTALRRLRVFQPEQQSTISFHRGTSRLAIEFERAMFPQGGPALTHYELYLDPDDHMDVFDAIDPSHTVALRLSGEVVLADGPGSKRGRRENPDASTDSSAVADRPGPTPMPALRRLALVGVTGTYFDRLTFEDAFPGAALESFAYVFSEPSGFEPRDRHLESLAAAHAHTLRSLVLLGCSRLSTGAVAAALVALPALEHFASHMLTVDDLRTNFVLALPPSLDVFKLRVDNAWYATALDDAERELCEAVEHKVLLRQRPLRKVYLCFRDRLMIEDDRGERWRRIASEREFLFQAGPWEGEMEEDM